MICYNIFIQKDTTENCGIEIIIGVTYVERNAGSDHAEIATWHLNFQCRYVLCHLIVFWIHLMSLCFLQSHIGAMGL